MNFNQELPKDVEKKLNAYIKRIKNIHWFKPSDKLDKKSIDKQVKFCLEVFGVKAGIEYRWLKTPNDWGAALGAARDAARDAAWVAALGAALGAARVAAWDAAKDAAWDAARDAAWGAALGAARDAAWDAAWVAAWDAAKDAAWDAARDAAWGAARDAAWGAADILVENLADYQKKYPQGNFKNLIQLWEMGLYPIGVIDGKFVVYIPPCKL